MNIKQILHKIFFKNTFFKKIYIKLAIYKENTINWFTYVFPIYKQKLIHPKTAFLVFTPAHKNLGDQAIALAEKKMFDSCGISFFEITEKTLRHIEKYGKLSCFNGSTLFIHGGGYLGTIWFDCELLLRRFIAANPKSTILALPNTIYYENTESGQAEFENSKQIYNTHKNLTFYAREKQSFEIMKGTYNNVKLSPDMVLSLNECNDESNRSGCLLCLRNDCEKTMTIEQQHTIEKEAQKLFGSNYKFTDMYAPSPVSICQRETELQKKFTEFRTAELVITDRLHGMIFCAITGTPCIVLSSKSHKINGCYEWINNLEYIRFAKNENQISEIYESIPKKVYKYSNEKFTAMFDELKNDIIKTVNPK